MRELIYEQPKPRYPRKPKGWRAKHTAKKRRATVKSWPEIREYVFARERGVCRCCRKRLAESMHEIVFRSAGGKVSKKNSVALCGDGVRGCHGFAQRHEIMIAHDHERGAEATLTFAPLTRLAAEWMAVKLGEHIESPVMADCEAAQ